MSEIVIEALKLGNDLENKAKWCHQTLGPAVNKHSKGNGFSSLSHSIKFRLFFERNDFLPIGDSSVVTCFLAKFKDSNQC